jgi:hypothetical protein
MHAHEQKAETQNGVRQAFSSSVFCKQIAEKPRGNKKGCKVRDLGKREELSEDSRSELCSQGNGYALSKSKKSGTDKNTLKNGGCGRGLVQDGYSQTSKITPGFCLGEGLHEIAKL